MPRNPDDTDADAAQTSGHSTTDTEHTVLLEDSVATRLTRLAASEQVELHTMGGSIFRSEEDGPSLAFLVSELQASRGQGQLNASIGVLDVTADPRQDRENSASPSGTRPHLKITATSPIEAYVIRDDSEGETRVVETVSTVYRVSMFDPQGAETPDEATQIRADATEPDQDAGTSPGTQQQSPDMGVRETTQPARDQSESREQTETQDEPSAERREHHGSLPLNVDEEIRALSTMFDGISRSDFWILDNGNVGTELSMVPTSDAVDAFEVLIEYDDSFPEYPPRVWVQKPDLSSDDESVVEIDHYGDARIQYIDPHTWAEQKNTEIALEYLAGWATAYCKRKESTTGEEMIRQTREYAEEAGHQIIDGFAGRVQNDDGDTQTESNQNSRNTDGG
jgi:hypothetical protein